jgi:hypothetical protein
MISLAEELRNAVKNGDYDATEKSMENVCCKVLRYQKRGRLIPKEESCKALCFSTLPDNPNVLLATYSPLIEVSPNAVVVKHSCKYYGREDGLEGVISQIFYAEQDDKRRLLNDNFLRSLGLASLNILGFGDRWRGKGDITPVFSCAGEGINLSDDVLTFSKLDLYTFLKEVEKFQRTMP